jgi:hypothetical protein
VVLDCISFMARCLAIAFHHDPSFGETCDASVPFELSNLAQTVKSYHAD